MAALYLKSRESKRRVPAWVCLHQGLWCWERRWAPPNKTSAHGFGLQRRSPENIQQRFKLNIKIIIQNNLKHYCFSIFNQSLTWGISDLFLNSCFTLETSKGFGRRPTSFCSSSGSASVSSVIQKLRGAILAVMSERSSFAASVKRFSP